MEDTINQGITKVQLEVITDRGSVAVTADGMASQEVVRIIMLMIVQIASEKSDHHLLMDVDNTVGD